jgi:K+ transporter
VLIGFGLCYLAWAERSVGLATIAAVYLALSLAASLYDIENLYYYVFGSGISPAASALPNVLLPALVLLLSGAGAWVVQRRQRAPVPEN